MLRPLDIVILLKLHVLGEEKPSQMKLAELLHISSRSVNEGLKRATAARLYSPFRKAVNTGALEEALLHGVRYFVPPVKSGITMGIPTSWAAEPLSSHLMGTTELPPVWPSSRGNTRGNGLLPIHQSVPHAVEGDPKLYELLCLVDALRDGRARERELASSELKGRLA